jgi:hypothetical protein
MALVNVTNVIVLDNPQVFSNDFQFEVSAETHDVEPTPKNPLARWFVPRRPAPTT